MATNKEVERMHEFLERSVVKVRNNVVIVEASELQHPYLIHINASRNPKYIPRIGHKQAMDEDRTMPRITASPYLVGCIIGYAMLYWNFMEGKVVDKNFDNVDWDGGIYIYKLPFEVCLRPNSKLVYDQQATNEHWLVNYKPGQEEQARERIGKIVVATVSSIATNTKDRDHVFELFIEVTENVPLNATIDLDPGYYHVTYTENRKVTWRMKDSCQVTKITKEDFMQKKRTVADRLSIDNSNILKRWGDDVR